MYRHQKKAFTLIEMLTVIAIIGILFSTTTFVFSTLFAANKNDVAKEKIVACVTEANNLVNTPTHFLAVDQSVSHIHLYDIDEDGYFEAFAAHNGFPGSRTLQKCTLSEEDSETFIYYLPPETGIEIPGTISGSPPIESIDKDYPLDLFWFCGLKMRSDAYRIKFYESANASTGGAAVAPDLIRSVGVCYVYDKKAAKRTYRILVNFYTDTIQVTPVK